jgi:nucleoid DNA-binding protein
MGNRRKEIIYFLANRYDLSLQEVERIVDFQFKFVAKIMGEGVDNTVRLPYFGKFKADKRRVMYLNKLKKEKDKKNAKENIKKI